MASEPTKIDEFINKDMAEAVDELNRLWDEQEKAKGAWFESVVALGESCIAIKAKLKHGDWSKIFENGHMKFSRNAATRYMKVAELVRSLPNRALTHGLPSNVETIALLSSLEPEQIIDAVSRGLVTPQSTRSEVQEVVREIKRDPTKEELDTATAERVEEEKKRLEKEWADKEAKFRVEINSLETRLESADKKAEEREKIELEAKQKALQAEQRFRELTEKEDQYSEQREAAIRAKDLEKIIELTNRLQETEEARKKAKADADKKDALYQGETRAKDTARSKVIELEKKIEEMEERSRRFKVGGRVREGIRKELKKVRKAMREAYAEARGFVAITELQGYSLFQVDVPLKEVVDFIMDCAQWNNLSYQILTRKDVNLLKLSPEVEINPKQVNLRELPLPNDIFSDDTEDDLV